jgi:hypothetical protein
VRHLLAILVLGVVVTMPRWAPAEEPDDAPDERTSGRDITRDQIEALHDLENAETDEQAAEAEQRFNDASQREVDRRRDDVEDFIERGGALPPSDRPGPPHP